MPPELVEQRIRAKFNFVKKLLITDNDALKSICRILGLRANNPTLGVQLQFVYIT